jgi:hypothetical protein
MAPFYTPKNKRQEKATIKYLNQSNIIGFVISAAQLIEIHI